jgi:hypothetical protein
VDDMANVLPHDRILVAAPAVETRPVPLIVRVVLVCLDGGVVAQLVCSG